MNCRINLDSEILTIFNLQFDFIKLILNITTVRSFQFSSVSHCFLCSFAMFPFLLIFDEMRDQHQNLLLQIVGNALELLILNNHLKNTCVDMFITDTMGISDVLTPGLNDIVSNDILLSRGVLTQSTPIEGQSVVLQVDHVSFVDEVSGVEVLLTDSEILPDEILLTLGVLESEDGAPLMEVCLVVWELEECEMLGAGAAHHTLGNHPHPRI